MNKHTLRLVTFGVLVALFLLSLSWFVIGNYQSGQRAGDLVVSMLLLAVPLALLYFSIGVLVEAVLQRREGELSPRMAKFIFYTPRIAGVVIALFTGLFALDVFSMAGTIWEKIGGFLIHAMPSIVMLAVAAVAWRWAWVGALVFGLAALFFLRTVIGNPLFGIGNLLLFVLPMAMVAVLFWLSWRWKITRSSW
jgi:hypothetical protein